MLINIELECILAGNMRFDLELFINRPELIEGCFL